MTKYEIIRYGFEQVFYPDRHGVLSTFDVDADYIEEYLHPREGNYEFLGSYDTLSEALEEFNSICVIELTLHPLGPGNSKGITGDYFELQRNEYDEDGEFDQGDIVEIKSDYYNAESEEG